MFSASSGRGSESIFLNHASKKGRRENPYLAYGLAYKRGKALSVAAGLSLDHGAFAALLMLPPVTSTCRALGAVLNAHSPLEEVEGAACTNQCESFRRLNQ